MSCFKTSLAVLATAVAVTSVADAQPSTTIIEPPRHRQGYYVAAGVLGLVNQNWDDGDSLGVWPGSAYSLRLGQLLTRRFGMGLFLDVGGSAKEKRTAGLIGFGLDLQFELARNLATRGGFGLGVVTLTNDADPDEKLRGSYGASYFLGLSYDWFWNRSRLTGGWAVTPVIQARAIPGDPVVSLMGFFGVELSYWTGLPRHQLELPESEAYKK